MSNNGGPDHVVVDGSNIATEGRSLPSLHQLQEAVMSFMEEYPDTAITVVVDATFGHRIDKKESKDFEEGIANNELVAPPAGAVGRGDAFVLGIADKADASVLSNDSFQEFHGEYEWLFDEGRLIGGKPVPHVGWVWVDRVPVRGPVSRKATGGRRGRGGSGGSGSSGGGRSRSSSRSGDNRARTGSREASEPMPTPKTPPPSRKKAAAAAADDTEALDGVDHDVDRDEGRQESAGSGRRSRGSSGRSRGGSQEAGSSGRSAPKGGDPVNELMPFLDFVESHPAGTPVQAVVDSYSSHGAYVDILDTEVRGYVPLRLMADPAPRSAKKIMKIGDEVSLVVVSFVADRRSIDCAVPDLADDAIAEAEAEAADAGAAGDGSGSDDVEQSSEQPATGRKKAAGKKAASKKAAGTKTAAKKAAGKKAAAKKAAGKKTAAKKAAGTKTAVKKAASKKAAAESGSQDVTESVAHDDDVADTTADAPAAPKKAAAKKAATKKAATKKIASKKAATKKTATKKAASKKTASKKATSKKTTATTETTTAGTETTSATTTAASKKAASKKAAATKSTAKKTATTTTAAKKAASTTTAATKKAAAKTATKKTASKKTSAKKTSATKKASASDGQAD